MSRFLFSIALLFACSQFAEAADKRVALVIGNGAYEHGNPLKNPAADAEDVSAALEQCGFSLVGGEAQLDLSHEAFERAVVDFRKAAAEAEVALFFFAGHGLEVSGENYLVPTDSKVEEEYQVKHRTVALNEIMGAMAGDKHRLKIIILDCCRDNPLGRGWSRSGSRGLSAVTDTPDGTVILFSAGPGRVAADGQGRNSPFSAVLKEEILSPGVELEGLFKRVGAGVYSKTGSQRPWMNSNLYESFVFLSNNPSMPVSKEAETKSRAKHWNEVEASISQIYELETRDRPDAALAMMKEMISVENRLGRAYHFWSYLTDGKETIEKLEYETALTKVRSEMQTLYGYQGNEDEIHFLAAEWLMFDSLDPDLPGGSDASDALIERSLSHVKRAIELNPGIAEYHYRLGDTLTAKGGSREVARRAYTKAIEVNPEHWNAWTGLFESYVSFDEDLAPSSIDPEGLKLLETLEERSRPLCDPLFYCTSTYLSASTAFDFEPIVARRLREVPDDKIIATLLEEVQSAGN